MSALSGRTLFISGASRGIGLAIALRAARDGANIAIAAKTSEPNPKLAGTVWSAAKEIEAVGGKALPIVCDIRFEDQVQAAVQKTVETFGGLDICVNNASAINLTGTLETTMKKYDLMHQINTRGTFLVSQTCLPHLLESKHTPHILNLSPPLSMSPRWFGPHVAYTMAKFGMSMCVLGMAEEFKGQVAVNALWPKTTIATAAVNMLGGAEMMKASRSPAIMADAAYEIFSKDRSFTGNFCIDEEVMLGAGLGRADLARYAMDPGTEPLPDFFVD